MSITRRAITYFATPGPNNTGHVLALAKERSDELSLRTVIVASTTGETGLAAAKLFKGYNLVVVTHSAGFHQINTQEVPEATLDAIEAEGGVVLTAQHAFGGIGRAVRIKLGTYQLEEIIAYTLRLFGQGMKVAFEMTVMAADAGLVNSGEEAMVIAGTGRGADTAVVMRAANAMRFFDLSVAEIVCLPGGHKE